ncbi:hypothetical protein Tco_0914484, partial [Tanacetum coccineum]
EQENESNDDKAQSDSVKGSDIENEIKYDESDLEKEEEYEDDDQEEEEFVHTPSPTNDNLKSNSDDVIKSDKEKGMDDATYQFNDDVDARLKEPTQTDKEVVQDEGVDTEMNDAQQGNENLETTQEQVVDDAHVTIFTVTKKTEVHVASSSCSSDLASKYLNFSDIPHADAKIVSPLDVLVHHEVPGTQAPTLLAIPVSVITESLPDPLYTEVTTLVDEHLDTRLGETREEFMNFLSESFMARIKEHVKEQLPQILPKEVSNFAPPVIESLIKELRDEVTLAKVSSQLHSTYEAASTLTEFELKKILINKIEKSKSYMAAPEHRDCYDSLKNSYDLDKDFFVSPRVEKSEKAKQEMQNQPTGTGVRGLMDSDIATKFKKENLGDKNDEPKKETASRLTRVKVMRKHGYGYLEEIEVRRADNGLYRFKEGDFPRLRINDIEDMLLLVVQNRLTNLLGDDVADFAIALIMFTRSLVIQKRVRDLQLGVESYQKKINVTNPDTTRPDLRKDTCTLHTKTLKDSFMSTTTRGTEYRHGVLAEEKMEYIGKEKSSFHDQGHQQVAKGKEDDEEFKEICWR